MPDTRKASKMEMSSVLRETFDVDNAMVENFPLYSMLETEGIKICLAHLNGLSFSKIAEYLNVDRRQIPRVINSPMGQAFCAHIQKELVANAKHRLYKNLDTALNVIEQILNSKSALNSDKLKAAMFLLDKALPTIETQKELELSSDPDYQVLESDRINLLIDKLSSLVTNQTGLSGNDVGIFQDIESTRKLLNG
ncbi:hypothetical protein IQ265_06505 [Nodosilinea sp. LEGE 06152]|uniref:hypothetical protein n=1 Tax=Nodosilinea sp. LEGE 06152 TaxID=2777966 RepID=UPI00187EC3A5|nr:hypothetical protein [Nodosilinea sp. LEGE 06152]MBE9156480.1 hypothetical protein [Nodosilinea sp. LEGE 06152]